MNKKLFGKKNKKQINPALYYVIKYGEQYYAPYMNEESYNDITKILSYNLKLAIRIGTPELVKLLITDEISRYKPWGFSYDESKVRVVKIIKHI
jgi:hypothetical protein